MWFDVDALENVAAQAVKGQHCVLFETIAEGRVC